MWDSSWARLVWNSAGSPYVLPELKDLCIELIALLCSNQWLEGDYLTYQILLSVAQLDSYDYLDQADFQQLPKAVLKLLDNCWSACSNGKFGFTTQRYIFEDCGGQFSQQTDQTEVYQQFAQRVGWDFNQGRWLYLDFPDTFDLEAAPTGNLPMVVFGTPLPSLLSTFKALTIAEPFWRLKPVYPGLSLLAEDGLSAQ